MTASHNETRRYTAPALEKGLDILELLALSQVGMTQTAIAAQLGKSVSEVFRMLAVLEQRGFIYRQRPQDLYYLSLRMFELAHRHPPTKRLLDVAIPQMRDLADTARQSVHLGVHSEGELLIIAQVESPEPAGVTVRLGRRSLTGTASGRALLASQSRDVQQRWLGAHPITDDLAKRLQLIARRGYEEINDESLKGITDISIPLLDVHGGAIAALTIPYLRRQDPQPQTAQVRSMMQLAANTISAHTHGSQA